MDRNELLSSTDEVLKITTPYLKQIEKYCAPYSLSQLIAELMPKSVSIVTRTTKWYGHIKQGKGLRGEQIKLISEEDSQYFIDNTWFLQLKFKQFIKSLNIPKEFIEEFDGIRNEILEIIKGSYKLAKDIQANSMGYYDSKKEGGTSEPIGYQIRNIYELHNNMNSIKREIPKLISLSKTKSKKDIEQNLEGVKMKCFKSGTNCPHKIETEENQVFVGIPFQDEFDNVYQYAIKPAIEELGLNPWKANEKPLNIDIMCKVCQGIQKSKSAVIDISTWNANVLFELGLIYGQGKSAVILKKENDKVPVDLKGIEYIPYSKYDLLKKNLKDMIKAIA